MNDDQIKKEAIAEIKKAAVVCGHGTISDEEAEGILRLITDDLEEVYINGDELSELSSTPATYRPAAL